MRENPEQPRGTPGSFEEWLKGPSVEIGEQVTPPPSKEDSSEDEPPSPPINMYGSEAEPL